MSFLPGGSLIHGAAGSSDTRSCDLRHRVPPVRPPGDDRPANAQRKLARNGDFECTPNRRSRRAPLAAAVPAASRHDRSTQTLYHDAHNHSLGPGYSAAQIYDFSLLLCQGVLEQLALLEAGGVERFLWMPIPTNIEGGDCGCCGNGVEGIGRTYYMPDRYRDNQARLTEGAVDALAQVGQYYNTSVDWQTAKAWLALPDWARQRVLLAVTGVNLADPHGIHTIMRLKLEYPAMFHWIGEITVFKEVVDEQNRNYTASLAARSALHNYLNFSARAGMGVTLHCDVSNARRCLRTGGRGRAENLAGMSKLVAAHPDAVIVWAHMGGLGKFSPPPRHHAASLRTMLAANPKLHIDLSWDAVARYYSPHPQPAANLLPHQLEAFDVEKDARRRRRRIQEMARLIQDFPDRFLMGSDALVTRHPDSVSSSYGIYTNQGQGPGTATAGGGQAALFDYLPQDTLDLVLRGNFDRLYDRAQAASTAYESTAMQDDMRAVQRQTIAHKRTPNNWPDPTPAPTPALELAQRKRLC